MDAFLLAFGAVFVAELGDKSQLLILALATRYRPIVVFGGLVLGASVLMALSVAAGGALSTVVPERATELGAGLIFLAFAAWTLFGPDDDDEGDDAPTTHGRGVLAVAGAFAVAELGDKTMLVAFTLGATNGLLGTWAGATLGEVAASGLAIVVGHQVGRRLPERTLQIVTAALFALFGLVLLVAAIRG